MNCFHHAVYYGMVNSDKKAAVLDFIKKNLAVGLSLHSDVDGVKTRRSIQHFSLLKMKDVEEQAIYENILRHSLSAELACPGAGWALMQTIVTSNVAVDASPKNRREVLLLLRSAGYSATVTSVLEYLLDVSNSTSKIALRKSSSNSLYVEVTSGYSFDVKPLLRGSFDANNVAVVCIDGYIESVSEIHHLLDGLSAAKMPCVFVVRGMSEDVLHTLKVNNERGTLKVLPIVIPFDVENVNTLVDLSVVCRTDIISSLKGQLISSIDPNKLGCADSVKLVNNSLIIKNRSTDKRVETHLENIKKLQAEKDPAISDVFRKRIHSLTANCIDVCVPEDVNYYSNLQQLSEGIRLLSCLLSKSYSIEDVVKSHYDSYSSTMKDSVFLL